MYCTRCGYDLAGSGPSEPARYCSRCGTRTSCAAIPVGPAAPPFMLDKRNKKIAGVCAGFARHLGIDVVLMRVLWLGIALCTGVGFLAYLAAWIVIPADYGWAAREGMVHTPQTSM